MFTNVVKCLHGRPSAPNKGDNMPEMDTLHATILEGYWWGLTACEIAEQVGETPRNVAVIMDTFRELGY